jgi:hypothetical protein
MTIMFLWLFYRAKEDWSFVLGLQHPWDAHHHEHHGHDEHEWVREKKGESPKLQKKEEH